MDIFSNFLEHNSAVFKEFNPGPIDQFRAITKITKIYNNLIL